MRRSQAKSLLIRVIRVIRGFNCLFQDETSTPGILRHANIYSHSPPCDTVRDGIRTGGHCPARTNAFRFLRKIVTFDAGGNEPRKLVCHAGPSKDELTPLYTLEALGPMRFRAPEGRVFNMTNYFISGAKVLWEVRGGTYTFKEIPEPPPSSNNFPGLRLRAGSVRAVLWGALGLLSLGIAVLLFARKKPSR